MSQPHEHILTASGVKFAYRPGQNVLDGVDLVASAGRVVCVLGSNGSGKTTLLGCLLGQHRPGAGSIELDGRAIDSYSPRRRARLMAYVPQQPDAAFAFTAAEIVLAGRLSHTGILGLTTRQDQEIGRAAMEMTGTLDFADRMLDELSGGEAQCVMVARALAQQPSVMLLDEPTSHLDIANQLKIYRMMRRLADDWQMAVICVSHDINLAARFADELVLMRHGRVVAGGSVEQVIDREILAETYGVQIDLIESPGSTIPIVQAR
ncbi:MAG: ABC transporter ATP-binding protein [Phycisphaerae bacterium]|nr:ABC transporter ATP-binding protein [Phycisphaerae bacterium]MDP7287180.1 ABC transporter ATP-binding protein [Phycisphaerae bacterium]